MGKLVLEQSRDGLVVQSIAILLLRWTTFLNEMFSLITLLVPKYASVSVWLQIGSLTFVFSFNRFGKEILADYFLSLINQSFVWFLF